MANKYVPEKTVAELLNVSIKKLQKDRQQNIGLPYHKLGKLVRYDLAEVHEILRLNKHIPMQPLKKFCGS